MTKVDDALSEVRGLISALETDIRTLVSVENRIASTKERINTAIRKLEQGDEES